MEEDKIHLLSYPIGVYILFPRIRKWLSPITMPALGISDFHRVS